MTLFVSRVAKATGVDAIAEEPLREVSRLPIRTTLSNIISELHDVATATTLIPVTIHDPRAASADDDLKSHANT
jgi:hypothetical protein